MLTRVGPHTTFGLASSLNLDRNVFGEVDSLSEATSRCERSGGINQVCVDRPYWKRLDRQGQHFKHEARLIFTAARPSHQLDVKIISERSESLYTRD